MSDELRSRLYVALDADHIDRPTFEALLLQSEEVGRMVGGLRAAVQRRRDASTETTPGARQL